MEKNHVVSDLLFDEAESELSKGNHWIAYNTKTYYLDNGDMFFFPSKDEATTFADDSISDQDAFAVIHANSLVSLMLQLPYGADIHFNLTEKELEELFKSFNWNEANYDPLHVTVDSTIEQKQDDIVRMETLLAQWETLYAKKPEAALQLAATYWEGRPMEQYKNDFITIKNDLMKETIDYLSTKVRNHGFGETLTPAIEAQLNKAATEFTVPYKTEVNKRDIEATLYFGKSDKTDHYFFNRYDCRMKNEKDEMMAQTFYINNGWGVTLKEAYNLLNGRAVHKELTNKDDQKYNAWIQLDFSAKDKQGNYERKQYHENYGYDLKTALSNYPIQEMMKPETNDALIRSLEKGNVQMVTINAAGGNVKVFIEANPQYKTVIVYDNKMNRMDKDQRQELMKQPEIKEEKSKEQKQGTGQEDKDGKKQEKGRKKNDDLEDKGLVKKRNTNNHNRGMGVH